MRKQARAGTMSFFGFQMPTGPTACDPEQRRQVLEDMVELCAQVNPQPNAFSAEVQFVQSPQRKIGTAAEELAGCYVRSALSPRGTC